MQNDAIVILTGPHAKFFMRIIFVLQEVVVGVVPLTKEFATNGYSCGLPSTSTASTLTDVNHGEDGELSLSGRLESKRNDILIQWKHFDVSVCLVDCRKDTTTTTTMTQSGVLNTNIPCANQAATGTFISTRKKHACDYCAKEFRWKSDMITHVRTHTGERPYSCDQCEYISANKSDLTRHIRTHTGENPFSCDVCGKSFGESGNLKRHQLTHSGDKQHRCDQCGKKFSLKCNLTRHLLTHTGDKRHQCEQCGRLFSQKCHLTQHIRTHTGDKPYGCDVCGKVFGQSSTRNEHTRRCSKATKP